MRRGLGDNAETAQLELLAGLFDRNRRTEVDLVVPACRSFDRLRSAALPAPLPVGGVQEVEDPGQQVLGITPADAVAVLEAGES